MTPCATKLMTVASAPTMTLPRNSPPSKPPPVTSQITVKMTAARQPENHMLIRIESSLSWDGGAAEGLILAGKLIVTATETTGAVVSDTELRAAMSGSYAAFIGSGSIASWAARIPQIRDGLHLRPSTLGLALLAIAAGSLLAHDRSARPEAARPGPAPPPGPAGCRRASPGRAGQDPPERRGRGDWPGWTGQPLLVGQGLRVPDRLGAVGDRLRDVDQEPAWIMPGSAFSPPFGGLGQGCGQSSPVGQQDSPGM